MAVPGIIYTLFLFFVFQKVLKDPTKTPAAQEMEAALDLLLQGTVATGEVSSVSHIVEKL